MASVNETKRKRQNRTVTLYLGNTLAEYQKMIATEDGIPTLIRRVEIADSLNWGHMAGVSQALGIDTQQAGTWVALEEANHDAISPMALWGLVQWFRQLSPVQLNLALGVEPPTRIIEDEKHVTECGEKAYVPVVYAPKEALIWWIDYIDSVSEDALRDSLERFRAIGERLTHIIGATVDG